MHNLAQVLQGNEGDQLRHQIVQKFIDSDPQQLRHWLMLQSPQLLESIRLLVQTGSDDRVRSVLHR